MPDFLGYKGYVHNNFYKFEKLKLIAIENNIKTAKMEVFANQIRTTHNNVYKWEDV